MDSTLTILPTVSLIQNVALEPVWSLEHTPTDSELLHVIRGSVRVILEERQYTAGPGDTVITPAGIPHRDMFNLDEEPEALLIHFTWPGEAAFLAAVGNDQLAALPDRARTEAARMFDAMRSDFGTGEADCAVASSRLLTVLMLFYRDAVSAPGSATGASTDGPRQRLVAEAKTYI